jgi:carbonic anhydrase
MALSRRSFMHAFACGCAAVPAAFAAAPVWSAGVPKTTLTADQGLALLKEGNAAFVKGEACTPTAGLARLDELAKGQGPFATIIGCADSRTAPEHFFSRGVGELFVVRVAGNTVDTAGLGSVEYGVAALGTPLIVVLGHTHCGAVSAAVKVVKENATYPGHIGDMVAPIVPAVKSVAKEADVVAAATEANVRRTVAQLQKAKPIVAKAVVEGKVKIVGAVCNLETRAVTFLS